MQFVKNNLISIICGLVALLAVGALYWPTGARQEQLQATLASRKTTYDSLQSMLKRKRALPNVSLDNSTTPLSDFPSQAIYDAGKKAIEEVTAAKEQMLNKARELNEHKLLLDGCLPNPGAGRFAFRDRYQQQLELLTLQGQRNDSCIQYGILGGGLPSNDAEAAAAEPANPGSIKIYVDSAALELNPACGRGTSPEAADIWQAQLQLWIQQDVAEAIKATNQNSRNVLEAPIKRLRSLRLVSPDPVVAGTAGGAGGMGGGISAALNLAPPTGGTEGGTSAASATGRASNEMYDVYHFRLELVVDAEKIPQVLEGLCRGRFITVLEMNVEYVDSVLASLNENVLYGRKPAAQLSLLCETIFLRSWTAPLMPQQIKQKMAALGIMAAEAPANEAMRPRY